MDSDGDRIPCVPGTDLVSFLARVSSIFFVRVHRTMGWCAAHVLL